MFQRRSRSISGVFKGFQGALHAASGDFKGVLQGFRGFQRRSRGFQRFLGDVRGFQRGSGSLSVFHVRSKGFKPLRP